MEEINYRGWIIRQTDNLWALAHGYMYEYSNDEKIHIARNIEEAKEDIDERTDRFENFLDSKINEPDQRTIQPPADEKI